MTLICLIPAYNEQERIGQTVKAALSLAHVDQVVVIDDGSQDNTRGYASKAGAQVISQSVNQGKGQALNTGWQQYPAEFYLLLDGDLGVSAKEAQKLIGPVVSGQADMTIADFTAGQVKSGERMGFGLAKKLASWGIQKLTGFVTNSPLSGQRCLRKEILSELDGFAPGFGVEVDLTIRALRKGFRLQEIPVRMEHRATGRSIKGFAHRGRQSLMVGLMLLRALRRN